jgi:ATP-binding cassette, subfamily B, bacterial
MRDDAGLSGEYASGGEAGRAPVGSNERFLIGYANRPISFILLYMRRHLVAHAVVFGAVTAAVGCAIGSQWGVKHLVDTLAGGRNGPIWSAFGIVTGLIAADNLLWRVGGWMASHGFVRVTGDVRRDLFQHLTGHSPAFFADRLPGMLASRVSATANAIYTVENALAWNVLPPMLAVAGAILMLMQIAPPMAVSLIGVSAVLAVVLIRLAARGGGLHHDYAANAAAVDGELVDVINNMPLVRAFGATLRERERFGSRVDHEMEARGRSLRYLEKLRVLHAASTAGLTAGLLAWAILLWERGAITTGDVVLVSSLGFTILHGTRDMAVALVDTIQHVARLSEALASLLLPHELQEAEDAMPLRRPCGAVSFRGVNYAYPGGTEPVLINFNLEVAPGSRMGLVGRSGSGKSTALALLQRLRDVNSGAVLIDGVNIATLTDASLREAISVVPQDVSLFHRSVMENIRYGRPEASDQDVRAAAEAAGCRDFLEKLPEGFETVVGDRGVKLSGGQRQRLAIARAFLRAAPILLLDEATSALDSESEQAVQRALDRLMAGRTVIAVAHRLSTLRDFDRIVVMQTGRIVQDGSPAALEAADGPFRDLLARQALHLPELA